MSTIDLSEAPVTAEPCPRCGERADEAGWCGVCGADLVPEADYPRFSRAAKDREARWRADPDAVGREYALTRQNGGGGAAASPVDAKPASVGAPPSPEGKISASVVLPDDRSVLMSQRDVAELAARREHDARLAAKYRGWKPLVIWYAFWCLMFGIGAISALGSGNAGGFFVCAAVSGLSAKYSHYLYNGGLRRVWFVIW
jgi:hypothetical protein